MTSPDLSSQSAQPGNHAADLAALPSDWRLVRVGRDKRPIAGDRWFDADDYSPDDALALNGNGPPAWGLKSGPASGVIVLDLDADGWRESFLEVTGHPITDLPPTIAWSSGRPGRSGHAFAVSDPEWWPHLANRRSWPNPDGATCWELRGDRHQAVIIGAHPDTAGYGWLPGRSPQEIPDPAPAPDWLLEALLIQEHPEAEPVAPTTADADRAVAMLHSLPPEQFTTYSDWLRIGMALHHTDPGLLTTWVDWCRPMPNFDEAECMAKWSTFGKGHRGRPATIATLHHLAKQYGYREPRDAQTTNGNGKQGREEGGKPSEEEKPPPTYTELLHATLDAIRNRAPDLEMEFRAQLISRFRRKEEQVTAALFRLLTEQETGHAAGAADTCESLDLSTIEGMDPLVDGFMPANDLGLTYGPKGSGKTHSGLALAFAVVDGTGFLDHSKPAEKGAVLFIASDSGAAPLKAAMQDLGVADHPAVQPGPNQRFYVWAHDAGQGMAAWCASIEGCVRLLDFVKAKGIRLVVIDSAKTVCAKAGISYLDNDTVSALLTFIKETICVHASVMILSHDGTEKGAHSGAKAWAEVPSIVHNITVPPGEDHSRLWRVVKNRMGPIREFRYELTDAGTLETVAGVEKIQDAASAVMTVLTEAWHRETPALSSRSLKDEICRRFGFAHGTIDNTLGRMIRARRPEISRLGQPRGHYKLAPRIEEQLRASRARTREVPPRVNEDGQTHCSAVDLTSSRPLHCEERVSSRSFTCEEPVKSPEASQGHGSGHLHSHAEGNPRARAYPPALQPGALVQRLTGDPPAWENGWRLCSIHGDQATLQLVEHPDVLELVELDRIRPCQ